MMIGNVWTDVSLATDCDLNKGEFYFFDFYIFTLLLMMDRDNERYSIMSYRLEGTQLIQSWLPGIGNAGFHQYRMPDSYMSDNYLFFLII